MTPSQLTLVQPAPRVASLRSQKLSSDRLRGPGRREDNGNPLGPPRCQLGTFFLPALGGEASP